jgi:hypothetical protein
VIAGARRLAAFAQAKPGEKVDCYQVDDFDDAIQYLIAERDENTCRKEMSPSELYEIGKCIEALEAPKAVAHREANLRHGSDPPDVIGRSHRERSGPTREKVGAAIGVSGSTWQRLKRIGDDAKAGNVEAQNALARIDSGESTTSWKLVGKRAPITPSH